MAKDVEKIKNDYVTADGSVTMTGFLPTSGIIHPDCSEVVAGSVSLATVIANKKFDVVFPCFNMTGWVEIDLRGANYSGANNAMGKLSKRIEISYHTVNGVLGQRSRYVCADPNMTAYFAISDVKHVANHMVVTIAQRNTNPTSCNVVVRARGIGDGATLRGISLSNVYTTDATVYPEPIVATEFRPITDNNIALGSATLRFSQLFAGTGTINISDERLKEFIQTLDAEMAIKFLKALNPISFKFKDGSRTHFGFSSQQLYEAMQSIGLTDMDFAGFIKTPLDENGKEVFPGDEREIVDYSYGIRDNEILPIHHRVLQSHADELAEIKSELAEIKTKLT